MLMLFFQENRAIDILFGFLRELDETNKFSASWAQYMNAVWMPEVGCFS